MIWSQKCANENGEKKRVRHGFTEASATMRKMGQNIHFNEGGNDASKAYEAWAGEGANYDFSAPGSSKGCGHFTAMVWYDTTHVGMCQSKCGQYIVANFYPPGNWQDAPTYEKNVLPAGTPFAFRPRNKFEEMMVQNFKKLSHGSNMIPAPELEALFRKTGEDKLADAVKVADIDGDGKIDAEEFVMSNCKLRHSDDGNCKELETKINRVVGFIDMDGDGNGKLDQQEFIKYLSTIPGQKDRKPEEIQALLTRFDTDGDGTLDYHELMELHDSGALSDQAVPVILTKWSEEVKQMVAKVPDTTIIMQLKEHLQKGKKAQVTLHQPSDGIGSIVIKLFIGNKSKILTAEWGAKIAPAHQKFGK